MKANSYSHAAVALAALFAAGCGSSSYGPTNNTARTAAGGAVAGAVLGGIIGNNTSGDTTKGAVIGAVGGGLAGAAIGHQQDKRQAEILASGDSAIVMASPPPSPTSQPYETVPARPNATAVWIPGHYAYTNTGYVWQSGRWENPPPGATRWVPPSWQPQGSGYVYVRSHWL